MSVTIACVLKSGGGYGWRDVDNLLRSVEKHRPDDARLAVVTDMPLPVSDYHMARGADIIALTRSWPGWWAKMAVFDLADDVVIYFDLDTVITGPIQPLVDVVAAQGGFHMLRDFYRPNLRQSGVMAWAHCFEWPLCVFPPESNHTAWRFDKSPRAWALVAEGHSFRGDGEFLHWVTTKHKVPVFLLQDGAPGLVVSYKVHVRPTGQLPPTAAAVCFHGRPRPSEIDPQPDWIAKAWN